MPYSGVEDLKLGNIPLPSYLDKDKIVQDAADEIDSYIGFVYQTPLDLTDETSPLVRPARLLIKRISANLSTGRLILAIAASTEDTRLHAYGLSLVQEAIAALTAIGQREVLLEGAPLEGEQAEENGPTGPLIHNVDSESRVESFYDRFMFGGNRARVIP